MIRNDLLFEILFAFYHVRIMKSRLVEFLLLLITVAAIVFNPNPSVDWKAIFLGYVVATVVIHVIVVRNTSRKSIALNLAVVAILFDWLPMIDPYAFCIGFAISPVVFLAGLF